MKQVKICKRICIKVFLAVVVLTLTATSAFAENMVAGNQTMSTANPMNIIWNLVNPFVAILSICVGVTLMIIASRVRKTCEEKLKKCEKKLEKAEERHNALNLELQDREERIRWLLGNEQIISEKTRECFELQDKVYNLQNACSDMQRQRSYWESMYHSSEYANKSLRESNSELQKELDMLKDKYQKAQELYPGLEIRVSNTSDDEAKVG